MTTPDIDSVRRVLSAPQDVELPDEMRAPHPGEDGIHPDDDPYQGMEPDFAPVSAGGDDADTLRTASALPINDLGNGQRFVLHFGEDVMFVPRVGWHVWDGRVWAVDPDMIATRFKAQQLSELVLAEVPYLVLSEDKMSMIAEERALKLERETLEQQTDDEGKLSAEVQAKIRRITHELSVIDGYKTSLSKIRTAHRTFARSTGNTAKIKAALTEAEVPLAKRVEDLDTSPLDVNTESGILRFITTPRPGTYPLVEITPAAARSQPADDQDHVGWF
mgnify:CR=1 FL=1